jgi:formylglycine-generating enzyme required for sulfatase activity
MVQVSGGLFHMGYDGGHDDERPAHEVELSAFLIDRHEVTNGEFARFVETTGHVTRAERGDGRQSLQSVRRQGQEQVVKTIARQKVEAAHVCTEAPEVQLDLNDLENVPYRLVESSSAICTCRGMPSRP